MSISSPKVELVGSNPSSAILDVSAGQTLPKKSKLSEFSDVLSLEQGKFSDLQTTVKKGDTLTGIVKQRYLAQGQSVTEGKAYKEALQIAASNGIADPNRINIGQKISWAGPLPRQEISSLQALQQRARVEQSQASAAAGSDGLLDKTLKRAVEKGFLAANQVGAAKEKIQAMSDQFGFNADHFAMVTLMESNGMDPKSDNGRCFGVIQFCEGPNSGAASVGMSGKAQRIKSMDLLSQLDLVKNYFSDLRLSASNGPMSLDDLYLSVLHPAAKSEKRRDINLLIPGKQAKDLYTTVNQQSVITRNSISHALMTRAQQVFPEWAQSVTMSKLNRMTSQIASD